MWCMMCSVEDFPHIRELEREVERGKDVTSTLHHPVFPWQHAHIVSWYYWWVEFEWQLCWAAPAPVRHLSGARAHFNLQQHFSREHLLLRSPKKKDSVIIYSPLPCFPNLYDFVFPMEYKRSKSLKNKSSVLIFTDLVSRKLIKPLILFAFQCQCCEKAFMNGSFLQSHMQRRHPTEFDISEFKLCAESLHNVCLLYFSCPCEK